MTAPPGPHSGASSRLIGLDLARAVALIGMIAVHTIAPLSGTGDITVSPYYFVFSGRASALFAVLAGVALALTSGRATPYAGRALTAARKSVIARAAVVLFIGLTLGLMQSGVAVILVNYAVLFIVALAWLGLRWRALAVWAAGWLVLSPVASHALRQMLPEGSGQVPSWFSGLTPIEATIELLLTGYYPVLTWTGYLLVGLALGRSPLLYRAGRELRPGVLLAAAGAAIALLAHEASADFKRAAERRTALQLPERYGNLPTEITVDISLSGTTPTDTWWWLAIDGPHSGTPFDLVATTGTALFAIGACLALALVLSRVAALWLAVPLAATGAMTLTIYTGHVTALAATGGVATGVSTWALHVAGAVVFATGWRLGAPMFGRSGRGPLESVANWFALGANAPKDRVSPSVDRGPSSSS